MWWDAGINDGDRGKTFTYTITPVRGTGPNDLKPVTQAAATVKVGLPNVEENGISTWFNRAVVSSQAFSREFPDPKKKIDDVMKWLANGLENAFPRNPCQGQCDRWRDLSPDRREVGDARAERF